MADQQEKQPTSAVSYPLYFLALLAFVQFFSSLFSFTLEVFFRRNFGERYFNILTLVLSLLLLIAVSFASNVGESFSNIIKGLTFGFVNPNIKAADLTGAQRLFTALFIFGFIAAALFHRYEIWLKNREGERWHTRYDGQPLPFFRIVPLDEYAIKMYFEPVLGLLLAWIIGSLGLMKPATVNYLYIASVALFIKGQVVQGQRRSVYLDAFDHQIEARAIMQYVNQADNYSNKNHKGYPVMRFPVRSEEDRKLVLNAMARVNPYLREQLTMLSIVDPEMVELKTRLGGEGKVQITDVDSQRNTLLSGQKNPVLQSTEEEKIIQSLHEGEQKP